jgi:hypothetical protein
MYFQDFKILHTEYFKSGNEPGGIENATHNTSGRKVGYLSLPCPGLYVCLYVFICIVGWTFYSAGLIITREIACI